MCRHSYSPSHEKSEKMFGIVTCFMYPRVFTKDGSCAWCPTKYFGPRASQSFNPALHVVTAAKTVFSSFRQQKEKELIYA